MGWGGAIIGLGALAITAGCPHYAKLDAKSVSGLELQAEHNQICARGGLVDVIAVSKDGKKLFEGDRRDINENEFDPELVTLTASVGSFHDHSWNPPDDPLALLKVEAVDVTVTLKGNRDVTASASLVPSWACDAPFAYASGQAGNPGVNGDTGEEGRTGIEGGPGANGDNGYNSTVTIGWIQHGEGRLAIADVVVDGGGESVYVLDPSTKLTVIATGGAGGAGGGGGYGGSSSNGAGGNGARGGDGGDGGEGGSVTVRYDASSPELADLVLVNTSGGDAGAAGPGGNGGTGWQPSPDGHYGQDGRPGRVGREGWSQVQAMPGINQRLAPFATSGGPPRLAALQTPPPSLDKAPKQKHGKHEPNAPDVASGHELIKPRPGQKFQAHDTADGARYYGGTGTFMASLGARKSRPTTTSMRVESTRTRKHHFTIDMDHCVLAFHRPPGERRHVYDLDAPVECQVSGWKGLSIKKARLELDTEHDQLSLSWDGLGTLAGAQAKQGPIKLSMSFKGKRS